MADTWTLVLAAESGRKLLRMTGDTPMPFWAPPGGWTLLDETVARVKPSTSPDRTVVVVDRAHRQHVDALWGPARSARFVFQPKNRGTAAAALLGATAIAETDPDAIVIVTPADLGIRDAQLFADGLEQAVRAVESNETAIVLFGLEPEGASGNHGWIVPCRTMGVRTHGLQRVRAYVDRPWPTQASRLFAEGGVWNAMVVVARLSALLDAFKQYHPELAEFFRVYSLMPRAMREHYLADHYPLAPSVDLWREVLGPGAHLTSLFTWPAALGWSHLGSMDRLDGWFAADPLREIAS
jgi:mannose-1-phosphate guanylyltransferase